MDFTGPSAACPPPPRPFSNSWLKFRIMDCIRSARATCVLQCETILALCWSSWTATANPCRPVVCKQVNLISNSSGCWDTQYRVAVSDKGLFSCRWHHLTEGGCRQLPTVFCLCALSPSGKAPPLCSNSLLKTTPQATPLVTQSLGSQHTDFKTFRG